MENSSRPALTTVLAASNIVSALGFTTDEAFDNVRQGRTGLHLLSDRFDLPEPFMASEIDGARLDDAFARLQPPTLTDGAYTRFEQAAIVSAADALRLSGLDPANPRVRFILSTTKGNVHLLDPRETVGHSPEQLYLWHTADRIAHFFGNTTPTLVVSNACISGAAALIAARRELLADRCAPLADRCDAAVVIGADMLSRFVVSGFQSFKALSAAPCRPFDAERTGLNLGEAAATIILTRRAAKDLRPSDAVLTDGAIRNDANHISGPSRTGEGCFRALRHILRDIPAERLTNEIAFVNAHGTATPYNDEMESIALTRAGLDRVPVNSLKGYFGHTLGAAGVLETILAVHALRAGIVLPTAGFRTSGVTRPIRIADSTSPVTARRCVKMLSGFGGCNAALLLSLHAG